MKDQIETTMDPKDAEFHIALGWLTALSVSIVILTGIS
jgi:hypothetical protein